MLFTFQVTFFQFTLDVNFFPFNIIKVTPTKNWQTLHFGQHQSPPPRAVFLLFWSAVFSLVVPFLVYTTISFY